MNEEGRISKFIDTVIFLVKLFNGLEDKFMAEKLYEKLEGFVSSYIKFSNPEKGGRDSGNVAQSSKTKDLSNSIMSLLDFLDYLEHTNLTSTTPLLYSRRNLLDLKLYLLKRNIESVQEPPVKIKEEKVRITTNKSLSTVRSEALKENSNKERIFDFIKRSPSVRTRDIVDQFSVLSERTVKRNLKELIESGFLNKQTKDNAVYYIVR